MLTEVAGSRGAPEHDVRVQILKAANDHFRHYGYAKTTVADIARSINFSKAYIYRFFESKQAIGEAICSSRLEEMRTAIAAAMTHATTETDRLRTFIKAVTQTCVDLLFADRKLYEIVYFATSERWQVTRIYNDILRTMLRKIVLDGREAGEFERKTPLDEVCSAILLAMSPFSDPLILERNIDLLPEGLNDVTGLILRSLAP